MNDLFNVLGGLANSQAAGAMNQQAMNQTLSQQAMNSLYAYSDEVRASVKRAEAQQEKEDRIRRMLEAQMKSAALAKPVGYYSALEDRYIKYEEQEIAKVKIVPQSFRDELRNEIDGWLPKLRKSI